MRYLFSCFVFLAVLLDGDCNKDASRLFDRLMMSYMKLARPVRNDNESVNIEFKLKLTQILDVAFAQVWNDYRLTWKPSEFGNINVMHIPADLLWLPDIILYNNADGSPQVTKRTKTLVNSSGHVLWQPPVIYNSMCEMKIEWFPFDEQYCTMKFGSWSYYGSQLNMIHLHTDAVEEVTEQAETEWRVDSGVDIGDYQESVEWDLMSVPAIRHVKWYPCCDYPYIDITYHLHIRRKTLFYTINLITPCLGIALLTFAVFYLPCESNNKITLCVSVLVSLTVFFLLLVDMVPPTSITIPLIGRFLLFTMFMVSCSVCCTVIVLNIHYRTDVLPMPLCIRAVFLCWLPKLLLMKRQHPRTRVDKPYVVLKQPALVNALLTDAAPVLLPAARQRLRSAAGSSADLSNLVNMLKHYKDRAYRNAGYIAEQLKQRRREADVSADSANALFMCGAVELRNDWKFAAMVLDRLFLIVFSTSIVVGTTVIVFLAPTLRDDRVPITRRGV